MSASLSKIDDVSPLDPWYMETPRGEVQLRHATITTGTANVLLPASARVALALTELCCERASGKVYLLCPHATVHNVHEKLRMDALLAFQAVPELFYIPEAWSPEEQYEWKRMNPLDRLYRLFSRHGTVGRRVPVLPFALELQEQKLPLPRFGGVCEAAVTLYIAPEPYLGLTAEMRRVCGDQVGVRTTYRQDGREQPIAITYTCVKGWDEFSRWKLAGGRQVLQQLDRWFRNGPWDLVEFYGTLTGKLIMAASTAAAYGQQYGEQGRESVW